MKVTIDDNYQKYLGFSWKIDGKIIYFMFIVLPFSFSFAPFIFTKVMPCLVKILRKISNKLVCWETENSSASLTMTSESNNTGSLDFLGTQSHKTFKNIQNSKHFCGTLLALSFIIVFL